MLDCTPPLFHTPLWRAWERVYLQYKAVIISLPMGDLEVTVHGRAIFIFVLTHRRIFYTKFVDTIYVL
jgi:hypothetical protein